MSAQKRYALVAFLLFLFVLIFILNKKDTSFSKNDKIHPFQSDKELSKIEIITAQQSTSFSLKGEEWLTKDNRKINSKLVQLLIKNLKNIQIHSPVATKSAEEFSEQIAENTKTITLYSANKPVYTLHLSQLNGKDVATSKKGKHFFVTIKGSNATSLYNFVSAEDIKWLDKMLINLKPEEISAIQVEYPYNQKSSYSLVYTNETIELFNYNKQPITDAKPEAITDYRYFFSGIGYSNIDTVMQAANLDRHLFRLKIITNVDQIIHIDGFELLSLQTQKVDIKEFAAIINNKVLVKLNYSDFDPILLEMEYFLKNR